MSGGREVVLNLGTYNQGGDLKMMKTSRDRWTDLNKV